MTEIEDHGHWDVLQHLIQERADVNKIDSRTRTPLYQAALMGAQNAVKALIEADANLEKLDKRVWSPELCVFFLGGGASFLACHFLISPPPAVVKSSVTVIVCF